jgi:hypothetical protein
LWPWKEKNTPGAKAPFSVELLERAKPKGLAYLEATATATAIATTTAGPPPSRRMTTKYNGNGNDNSKGNSKGNNNSRFLRCAAE